MDTLTLWRGLAFQRVTGHSGLSVLRPSDLASNRMPLLMNAPRNWSLCLLARKYAVCRKDTFNAD